MDVRGKKMDFFPALKAKAAALKNGEGKHVRIYNVDEDEGKEEV